MQYKVNTPEEYIESIPEERRAPIEKLRAVINENLPSGFEECISYGMIGWVVPHSIYPAGYHCDPKLPLPFLSIASQKNFIGFYHMGIYADHQLTQWFQEEYAKVVPTKLDMGKSCIRLKKPEHIPYDLIGELCTLITPEKWIEVYEGNLKR
ncbi:DUF1801 domain-containing protein [Phaeocystidibacter marisrubri]|uniref:DUF1801 domain-containing protein n=1 Tax=Phaeocystidibacter marisrubri TaxID=1577780 RepID=A0A6L3ZI44_9FLAO|nr:DUF1801 domain-containing protein [Phaeocystidibacter marisrubri]KAB2817507.1 DUF1801 domain-containing protein [Phaeocystidibacter marisrubri]GGH75002.1 hypothetical protein GCM10011318_21580 [Phaeocystidibacter marisrubri]